MKCDFILAEESFRQWKKDPKYVAEYAALEKEFALADAPIDARRATGRPQEEGTCRRRK